MCASTADLSLSTSLRSGSGGTAYFLSLLSDVIARPGWRLGMTGAILFIAADVGAFSPLIKPLNIKKNYFAHGSLFCFLRYLGFYFIIFVDSTAQGSFFFSDDATFDKVPSANT